MTPEAWATNLGAMAAALYAGWQSRQAKKAGQEASDRSEPTSNGFAKKVTDGLARLETRMDDMGRRVVRIEDLSEDKRQHILRMEQRLDQHIDKQQDRDH